MKCILHIGTEKTASTLMQHWLYDNKDKFGNSRVYLSPNLGRPNNRLVPAFFQSSLDEWAKRHGIQNEHEKEKYFNGFLESFKEEVARASLEHDTFIITSEHLHSRLTKIDEVEQLRDFLCTQFNQVVVVCYFRNQFDTALSRYSTNLKVDDCSKELNHYLEEVTPENYYYNYLSVADNWSECFGIENCVFRIFDKQLLVHGDIRKDFIVNTKMNMDLRRLDYRRASANESLYALQSAVCRAINRQIPHWTVSGRGVNGRNVLAKVEALKIESLSLGKIQSERRDEIQMRFENSNKAFFSKYFKYENRFSGSELSVISSDMKIPQVEAAVEDSFTLGFKLGSGRANVGHCDKLSSILVKIATEKNLGFGETLELIGIIALKQLKRAPLIRQIWTQMRTPRSWKGN